MQALLGGAAGRLGQLPVRLFQVFLRLRHGFLVAAEELLLGFVPARFELHLEVKATLLADLGECRARLIGLEGELRVHLLAFAGQVRGRLLDLACEVGALLLEVEGQLGASLRRLGLERVPGRREFLLQFGTQPFCLVVQGGALRGPFLLQL